ncbi:degenerin mec-4-like [Lytechinus pictus]|uniref:degenerin mec-4-like n=1 Tax=Lytechinus pictus TaxID=7653 RepID=UPI0030BA0760
MADCKMEVPLDSEEEKPTEASSPEKFKAVLEKPKALVKEMTNDILVKSWRTVVQSFCKSTTMHGVSRLIESTRAIFRLAWLLTVLTFLCILMWQAYSLVDDYRGNPATTAINMVPNNKLSFPAVTVCNMNRLRRSKLAGTRFEPLLDRKLLVNLLNPDGRDESDIEGDDHDAETSPPLTPVTTTTMASTTVFEEASNSSGVPPPEELSSTPDEGLEMSTEDTTVVVKVDDPDVGRQKRSVDWQIKNKHLSSLRRMDDLHARAIPYINAPVENDDSNWSYLLQLSESDDFQDFIGSVNPSKEELRKLGHQPEEFILQCSFNQHFCDYRNFTTTFNSQYGNCFTFNRPAENKSILETGKTGSRYGLHLTLFTDQSEYIGLLSHQSGVRVAIHEPNARPFPEDEGITASTGTLTSIGLRLRNMTRLSGRYSDCRNPSEFIDGYDYSLRACLNACYQSKLRYECGCVSDVMGNTTICSTLDPRQDACQRRVDEMAMDDKLGCKCVSPCSEIDYERFASFSKWPTERADAYLTKKINKRNRKAGNMTVDASFRRKNLVRVEIFYEKLNYESYTQMPKYTFGSLLGGIGGIMGFFAGMSLITVFELCGFIIQLLGLLCGRLTTPIPEDGNEGETPPSPHESRIGKVGRRLTKAFRHHPHHGRGGSSTAQPTDL